MALPIVTDENGIRWITLDRPEILNALCVDDLKSITSAVTVVQLAWADGTPTSLVVEATADTQVELRWLDREGEDRERRLTLTAGERVTVL